MAGSLKIPNPTLASHFPIFDDISTVIMKQVTLDHDLQGSEVKPQIALK